MSRFKTRAEYDANTNRWPENYRWQFWPPPLRLATWREIPLILLWKLFGAAIVIVGVVAVMAVLGMMMDGASHRSEEHSRCMKQATNGYEIERCR